MAQLKIVNKNVNELVNYENNPRDNDGAVDAVASSIKEFGFKVPVIIDKNNVIVCGHTRVKACKKLGIAEVPCIIADDLTDEQIKAFRLADNKTSELATWDSDKLFEELKQIDLDMEQFGFDELEEQLDKQVEEDNFDPDEPLPENPYSQLQDIYLLKDHRLMCGDSTVKDDVDKLMDGKAADLIEVDPPYNCNIGTKGKQYKELGGYECGMSERTILNDNMDDASFKEFLAKTFTNLYDNVKEGGGIYVFHSDGEGLNFRLAFVNAGFKFTECLIWKKDSLVLSRLDYHYIHEPILYGWKPGAAHTFVDDRTQHTVLEYPRPKVSDLHPTMKPLALVSKLILNSSKKGDLVLDLFSGSGTTLCACEQIERKCFTMELDPKYADVGVKRFLRLTKSYDDCFLLRNGEKIPLKDIPEFQIELDQ